VIGSVGEVYSRDRSMLVMEVCLLVVSACIEEQIEDIWCHIEVVLLELEKIDANGALL
jgi:hypothetical protein